MGIRLSRGEFFFPGGILIDPRNTNAVELHARRLFFEALERLAPKVLGTLKSDVWPDYQAFRAAIDTATLPMIQAERDGWEELDDQLAVYAQFWSTVADPSGTLATLPGLGDDAPARLGELDMQVIITAARALEESLGRWASSSNLISKSTQQLIHQNGEGYLTETKRQDLRQRIKEIPYGQEPPEDIKPFVTRGTMAFINVSLTWGQEKAGIPEAWLFDKALDLMARWFYWPETMAAETWYPSEGAAGWKRDGPTGLTPSGDDETSKEAFIYRQQLDVFFKMLTVLSEPDKGEHEDHSQFPAFAALATKLADMQSTSESSPFISNYIDPATFSFTDISTVKPEFTATIPGWMPILESWQEFEKEAERAFGKALQRYKQEVESLMTDCHFVRSPRKHSPKEHFEWFVRYQVLSEGFRPIAAKYSGDKTVRKLDKNTIKGAVEGVGKLIGLSVKTSSLGRRKSL